MQQCKECSTAYECPWLRGGLNDEVFGILPKLGLSDADVDCRFYNVPSKDWTMPDGKPMTDADRAELASLAKDGFAPPDFDLDFDTDVVESERVAVCLFFDCVRDVVGEMALMPTLCDLLIKTTLGIFKSFETTLVDIVDNADAPVDLAERLGISLICVLTTCPWGLDDEQIKWLAGESGRQFGVRYAELTAQ